MNEQTPGPWEANLYRVFSKTKRIAEVETARCNHAEIMANAHLIAAAPEMLEALRYVVRWHRDNDSGEGELYGRDYVTTCIGALRKALPLATNHSSLVTSP